MATKMVYPVHGISKDRCHTPDIADPVCRQQTMTCIPAPLQNEVHCQLAGLQGISRLRALLNAGKSSAAEALVKAYRGKAGGVELRQPNEDQWAVIIPDLNQVGTFKIQYTDATGFGEHQGDFPTEAAALQAARVSFLLG